MHCRLSRLIASAVVLYSLGAIGPTPVNAANSKIVIAAPGIPPIFASVILYVAEKEGFFKKYGVNVEVRPFDTGTSAARAVISGDIEMAMSVGLDNQPNLEYGRSHCWDLRYR